MMCYFRNRINKNISVKCTTELQTKEASILYLLPILVKLKIPAKFQYFKNKYLNFSYETVCL